MTPFRFLSFPPPGQTFRDDWPVASSNAALGLFEYFEYFEYCVLFEDVLESLRATKRSTKAMTTLISANFETVAPTEADAQLARESSRRLATRKLGRRASVRIQLLDDGEEADAVAVPASALRLFLRLLTEMSQGHAVTLIPTHAEL